MADPADEISPADTGHDRHHRLMLVALSVAAILVLAFVVARVLDADDESTAGNRATVGQSLAAIASAARCDVSESPEEGTEHTTRRVSYRTNPPTSGDHAPEPAQDGIYEPGDEPAPESLVHTLEHGRVVLQYGPRTPDDQRRALEGLVGEPVKGSPGYHTILVQNNTRMRAALAATTWTRSITCARIDDRSLDAVRAFRDRFVDQAPELVP